MPRNKYKKDAKSLINVRDSVAAIRAAALETQPLRNVGQKFDNSTLSRYILKLKETK